MTQLLPHVSQTSLGETCAFYLDYITGLPSSLHSLHHKFVTPIISAPLLRILTSAASWVSCYHDIDNNKAPAILTLAVCAIALVVMSWRNIFRRTSPSYHNPNSSDRPYSYLTPDNIVDPPSRTYDHHDDDTEPDKLLLNHRKVTYELHFPPYSINDGTLSIGQLRQSAAEVTKTADPDRIRLLYKGKLLDNDTLPCRSEGLKQQSEILCVVSEMQSGARTPSDLSDAERTSNEGLPRTSMQNILEIQPPKSGRKSKSKRKNKGKKKKSADSEDENNTALESTPPPPPPSAAPRPPSSSTSGALPPPAPNLNSFPTPLEQVHGLTSYFQRVLLPLCDRYIANPPADAKSRDFEHKKLGETILAQVILKADGIEPANDETRNARRALIKEAQGTLNKLDAAENNRLE